MSDPLSNFIPATPSPLLFDDSAAVGGTSAAAAGHSEDKQRSQKVHVRVQQRNGRKTLTTIQGLPKGLDPKKVLKVFKKEFACNGCVVQDEELGEVIQLQGDHRSKVSAMLIEEGICKKEDIQLHGF